MSCVAHARSICLEVQLIYIFTLAVITPMKAVMETRIRVADQPMTIAILAVLQQEEASRFLCSAVVPVLSRINVRRHVIMHALAYSK